MPQGVIQVWVTIPHHQRSDVEDTPNDLKEQFSWHVAKRLVTRLPNLL